MNGEEKIVIASTSDTVIDYVSRRLGETGARNEIIRALSEEKLRECLKLHSPRFLFIEACFWHSATPCELLDLIDRYDRVRIYVFGFEEYTEKFLQRILRVGTDGFLAIRRGPEIFKSELRKALEGKLVIPLEIEDVGIDYLPETNVRLTHRDMQVIDLICDEMDNKTIADTLGLDIQTVRNRRSNIYAKINVTNTVGLLKFVFRKNIKDFNEFVKN